ncbi:hypothetical protein BAE44_0004711 [Dichanthelium oligosanthes]|uniref:Uncharacterized protein n=1 Tax=Dichanthelium oligosanthes TaxID=888268 RepID=A0A1E5WAJ6_9POAL|nr:hypothetical protein BAE44_0004711 [Dichanthelium oligosanthes]
MREVRKFKAHKREVMSLAVHPGGKLVLSASYGEEIKLWDWDADANWNCIRRFKQSQIVVHVVFNREGDTFASASLRRTVQVD